MYTDTDYATKKDLKAAVDSGRQVTVYQPGPFPGKTDGDIVIEGPQYPRSHRWYAKAKIIGGVIVKGSVK